VAIAKKDDAGQAEAQKLVDQAEDKGYIGQKVDPLPNSAHSLESGPDAPTSRTWPGATSSRSTRSR
jgi:hypothetical protein